MVDVVQLVERQFVVLVVVGSSPFVHPIKELDVIKKVAYLLSYQHLDYFLLLWRRHPDLNRGIKVLQTLTLPLGYSAII